MGSRISEASYYNGYKRPSNSGKCAVNRSLNVIRCYSLLYSFVTRGNRAVL